MSACAMLHYNNVTAAAWQCGKNAASQFGIVINTDSGSATTHGFTVVWNYVPAAQTLQMQCTHSPIFISCSLINGKLNDAVEACLQTHNVVLTNMVHP